MALYLVGQLKLRTLVLVHKTCLAEQWVERIGSFLPGAKVGRLQGTVEDVDGMDVVIAMIQSVCSRDYSSRTLADFGLLIVDEAHHEAAAAFSQAMLKINCTYILGLTATPERKDGMSYVNTYFLGPIFFQLERTRSHTVTVQVVSYDSCRYRLPPPTTRRGTLNLAAFITDVSEDGERNRMLASNIVDLAVGRGRKLLVLSDRRQHCTDLQALCEAEVGCGLYLGSMKQEALKQSEACQVILSTYAMVGEGFDNKFLDSVLFATPRSDVNQASGRILRETPGKENDPLIVDVVDKHGVFYAQFQKRKAFYNKQGFTVRGGGGEAAQTRLASCSFIED